MISIKESVLSQYFDGISDADLHGVKLLDFAEAAEFWAINFDANAKGLFDLADDSWVIQGPWSPLGAWIDAYNGSGSVRGVEQTIAHASNWLADEPVFLVQSSQQIVSLEFGRFFNCWEGLLAAFDDGPILMSLRCESTTVFCFSPLGQIMQAAKRKT